VAIHDTIISRKGKEKSLIKIKLAMTVWRINYIEMSGCNFIDQGNKKKCISNGLESW
jgi:hypothetical protein